MQKPRSYRYLFGPVPSRRLGRSLGVDPVPSKTCSYNCVYCQLGPTNHPIARRALWVPVEDLLAEFADWLREDGEADMVTVAGSGEPTLHAGLKDILGGIRRLLNEAKRPDLPVCVLTNGSLLHLPEVHEALALADIVKVTFSSPDERTWRAIHGPAEGLSFDSSLRGLEAFRTGFTGQLWLEVMVLEGINADDASMRRLAEMVRGIRPDRVQFNSPVRPPAQSIARPAPVEKLLEWAKFFDPRAEIIGVHTPKASHGRDLTEEQICSLLDRHPATAEQIAEAFHSDLAELRRLLEDMADKGRLIRTAEGDAIYYRVPARP
jgi:wyosine [tRNA(Phe)-imidazoG37] synthetase (radical SAM superfamily)